MIVIGAGRIGTAFHDAAVDSGEPCTLVTRDEGWDAIEGGPPGDPLLVCTRNDDLPDVIARVPRHRRGDLVFVQNGALSPWLAEQHLAESTRGLLFLAVPSKGAPIEPGPDPSPFTGPHALTVVRWLARIGVRGQVVGWPRFLAWEVEKLCWIAAFGLLCQVHDADVGTICDEHAETLATLVDELRRVCRATLNVDLEPGWLTERLVAYSRTIPTYQGSVKEWRWRNGWFVTEAIRLGIATPTHLDLLRQAGLGDRLPV